MEAPPNQLPNPPRSDSASTGWRVAVGVLVLLSALPGCVDRASLPGLPDPVLDDVEPAVRDRIRDAERAVFDAPESGARWGRLGEVYDVHDRREAAVACYVRAGELDPDEWRWPYFAGLLLHSGNPQRALGELTRAAELQPSHAPLQFHLGWGHYLAEHLDQAEVHFELAIEVEPELVNAWLGLARVEVARDDLDSALARLLRASAFANEQGAVHLHLAQVLHALGRHEEAAEQEWRTALSPRPAQGDGFAGLDDAVRDEVKLREGASSTLELWKAGYHLRHGDEALARGALDHAVRAAPGSPAVLLARTRMLIRDGDLDEAHRSLDHILELDPDSVEALDELATLHARAARFDAAEHALERAIALDPKAFWLKSRLAGLYVNRGRREEALELLQDALRDQPWNPDLRQRLEQVQGPSGLSSSSSEKD